MKGKAIEHLKLNIAKVNWFSTYRVHHRVAHRFREGRAFLLGDAAHIHSPVGGQGMNTGIGDAVNLAWKLAAVLKEAAPDSLLDTYEPERIAFARRLVATTDRVFTLVTRRGAVARLVRTRLVPLLVPLLFRLPPLRRFLFRTVSQIGVNYRNSPLSAGAAGAVRGGDRLPWVQTGPGQDNFAPLASLTGRFMCTAKPDPAWPKPAPNFSFRSTASRGSRRCGEPVSSAGRSISSGRTATSPWPTLRPTPSGCVVISLKRTIASQERDAVVDGGCAPGEASSGRCSTRRSEPAGGAPQKVRRSCTPRSPHLVLTRPPAPSPALCLTKDITQS